mmetsp:Transcript_75940/g.181677  ORF Transcript_75940/g.181677 Transcript_75940/m.181677 type:complete len:456 (-) Transcript_75940:2183-3550(-)
MILQTPRHFGENRIEVLADRWACCCSRPTARRLEVASQEVAETPCRRHPRWHAVVLLLTVREGLPAQQGMLCGSVHLARLPGGPIAQALSRATHASGRWHLHSSHLPSAVHTLYHTALPQINVHSESHAVTTLHPALLLIKHHILQDSRTLPQELVPKLVHQHHRGNSMGLLPKVPHDALQILLVFLIVITIVVFIAILLTIVVHALGLIAINLVIHLVHHPAFIFILVQRFPTFAQVILLIILFVGSDCLLGHLHVLQGRVSECSQDPRIRLQQFARLRIAWFWSCLHLPARQQLQTPDHRAGGPGVAHRQVFQHCHEALAQGLQLSRGTEEAAAPLLRLRLSARRFLWRSAATAWGFRSASFRVLVFVVLAVCRGSAQEPSHDGGDRRHLRPVGALLLLGFRTICQCAQCYHCLHHQGPARLAGVPRRGAQDRSQVWQQPLNRIHSSRQRRLL